MELSKVEEQITQAVELFRESLPKGWKSAVVTVTAKYGIALEMTSICKMPDGSEKVFNDLPFEALSIIGKVRDARAVKDEWKTMVIHLNAGDSHYDVKFGY